MIYESNLPESFDKVVHKAKLLWKNAAINEYNKDNRQDIGTCILGDGICVNIVPKRCRKPRKVMIIPSSSVAQCQGSAHYDRCYHVAIEYLKSHGIDAYYHYGTMD